MRLSVYGRLATEKIATLNQRIAKLEHSAQEVRAERDRLLVASYHEAVSITALAKAAGITRQQVYSIIKRAGPLTR